MSLFENGTLFINAVRGTNKGIYRCSADNGIGAAIFHDVTVTVRGKPDIIHLVP